MAVVNTTNSIREAGNGSKTAFDVPFPFYNHSDLKVYKIVNSTGVRTLATLNVDYTVVISSGAEGGTVTYAVAPTSLMDSFIERDQPYTQSTNIPAVGGVREEQLEKGLDKLCILILQLLKKVQLSLKFISSSSQVDVILPEPVAGKVLGWGQTVAANMENYTADSGVAAAEAAASAAAADASADAAAASAVAADASADAALVSETAAAASAASISGAIGTQAQMEAASDNTKIATASNMKWHPGVAKVWALWNGTGTPALSVSHGVTSLTDIGLSEQRINFATSFSTANFACVGVASLLGNSTMYGIRVQARAVGSVTIHIHNHENVDTTEVDDISIACYGDQ